MKPEVKLFPLLKDESQFSQWQRAFRVTCYATNMGDVIDPDYRPPPHEAQLFRNKIHWIFNVLWQTVRTIEGRNILYNHLGTLDGRAVYMALCRNSTNSSAAQLHAQNLMQQLTTLRLTKSYPYEAARFVSDYVRMLNNFNNRVENEEERLSEGQQRILLEASVSQAKPLYDIKRDELMDIAKGRPKFTLNQYIHLLSSTAQTMDMEKKMNGRRAANLHFFGADEEPEESTGELQAFLTEFKAYAGKREPETQERAVPRVDENTWVKMTIDSRKKWATISSEDKEKIFQSLLNHNTVPTFSANVTQIQDPSGNEPADDGEATGEADGTVDEDDGEASMQANVSSSDKGKMHPAALARMMGTSKPKKPVIKKSPSTRSANTVSWSVNSIAKQQTDPPVKQEDAPTDKYSWMNSKHGGRMNILQLTRWTSWVQQNPQKIQVAMMTTRSTSRC